MEGNSLGVGTRDVVESPRIFHPFGRLPVELRLRIWKLASSVQRNVDVHTTFLEFPHPFFVYTQSHPPSILQACKESREEGLNHYSLEFPQLGGAPRRRFPGFKHGIYINWKIDRLCLFNPGYFRPNFPYAPGDDPMYEKNERRTFRDKLARMGLRYLAINTEEPWIIRGKDYEDGDRWCYHFYDVAAELIPIHSNLLEEVSLFYEETWGKTGGLLVPERKETAMGRTIFLGGDIDRDGERRIAEEKQISVYFEDICEDVEVKER